MDSRFIQTEAAELTALAITGYTADAWSDEVFLDILQEKARQLEDERAYGEAREFARVLEQGLQSTTLQEEIKQRLTAIQAMMLVAAFPTLDPEEQVRMVRNHLLLAYETQANLKSKLAFWSKVQADPEVFKNLRLKLIGAVAENLTEIGGRKVKDWISDYNKVTNNKAHRTRIDQVQFISQHPSTRQLNAEQKQILIFVIDLYDWMRDPKQETGDVPTKTDINEAGAVPKSVPPSGGPVALSPRTAFQPIYKPLDPSSDIRPPAAPKTLLKNKDTRQQIDHIPTTPQMQITSIPPQASEEAKRQLKKLSEEALYDEPLSISQALINAGLAADEKSFRDSGTRAGTSAPGQEEQAQQAKPKVDKSKLAPVTAQTTKQPALAHKISRDEGTPIKPETSLQQLNSLPPAHDEQRLPAPKTESNVQTAPPSSFEQPAASSEKIVNLKKNLSVDPDNISSPQEFARITSDDLRRIGFENGLQKVKQKMIELSAGGNSLREAVNSFQRSPLYNLYISMVVAVMNDSGGDQKIAFERVAKNYEQANKPYLQRNEFLAVHKFKKELADLGATK